MILNTEKINSNSDDSIVVILSHANTEQKRNLLKRCLESIKSEKVIVSNYPVEPEFQMKSNWVLYTNKNEILLQKDFQRYNVDYSYSWKFEDGETVYIPAEFEHGYAVYCLIRRALLFCKSIGKEIVHIINYDYIIPQEVIDENNYDLIHSDTVFYDMDLIKGAYSTGMFSGKIDTLLNFFTLLKSPEDYYSKTIYGSYSPILEGKFTIFYKKQNIKINFKSIKDMPKSALIDVESGFPSIEDFIEYRMRKKENGKQ